MEHPASSSWPHRSGAAMHAETEGRRWRLGMRWAGVTRHRGDLDSHNTIQQGRARYDSRQPAQRSHVFEGYISEHRENWNGHEDVKGIQHGPDAARVSGGGHGCGGGERTSRVGM